MIIDKLGLLRADSATPRCVGAESGVVLLTADATTGARVLDIRKTGYAGLPIVVITDDDTHTCCSTTTYLTITIQACDSLDFSSTTVDTVATFPIIRAGSKGTLMVRRIHTQKKYIRNVIAVSTGATSIDILIFVGHARMDT